MHVRPVTTKASDRLVDAVDRMERIGARHLPVVDGDGVVIGMLSDRDIRTVLGDVRRHLRAQEAIVRLNTLHVEDVMSHNPVCVGRGATLAQVAELLVGRKNGAIPVTDDAGRAIGIVSYVDVIEAFLDSTDELHGRRSGSSWDSTWEHMGRDLDNREGEGET